MGWPCGQGEAANAGAGVGPWFAGPRDGQRRARIAHGHGRNV